MSRNVARCSRCNHEWYPRGPAGRPARCPACGVRFEGAVESAGGSFLGTAAAGCFGVLLLLGCCGGVINFAVNRGGEAAKNDPVPAPKENHVVPVRPDDPQPTPATKKGIPPAPHPKADPIAVAPMPRPVLLRPPPGWSSPWEQAGQVKARVRAAAYSPAPLTDGKGRQSLSPAPCLMVWLEFQNVGSTPRVLRRYQPSVECVLTNPGGFPLAGALFGNRSLDDPTPFNQELLLDGEPVLGLLAFDEASPPAGEYTLTLSAARVSESGRFVFRIPPSAWRR